MVSVRKLAPFVLGLAAVLAHTPRAVAQPASSPSEEELARARDLFREGAKLAEAGDWEGARERYERSLKIKHAALTLYNLGIAQQETGRPAAAIESFRAFLVQPVEPATQPYVEPVRATLKQLEDKVPRIGVAVRPAAVPGVVVTIDGRDVAAGEAPRAVEPGRHEVAAAAPGFGEVRQTVWLLEGTRTELALTLRPSPPPVQPSVALPITLAAAGAVCAVAGGIAIGIGARNGPGATIDTTTMAAGAAIEGTGALALGAAFLLLVTRPQPKAHKAAVAPWVAGTVGGVQVRF